MMAKLNPHELTTADAANWIREGDFEEAKQAGRMLALFLHQLSENKEAQRALLKSGISWIGADIAKLISDRLLDDPSVNKLAQQKVVELIKAGREKGSPEFDAAIQKLREKPNVKGKSKKSGVEIFAKMLVPNKQSKQQSEALRIAVIVGMNIDGNNKAEFRRIADTLNTHIDQNNQIMDEWRKGERESCDGWNVALPRRRVTPDQIEKDYRKFKSDIDAANDKEKGITRHRIK